MNAMPGRSPRPARPTAWARSWYVRSDGALVREVERDVRRHHAHQRHLGDVEALGDEAGPDEDVEAARREGVEDAVGGALALDDVAIEPADPQLRVPLADLALDALGAAAEVADPRRRAGRAARGRRPGAAAVMAAQRGPGPVVDERPVAVGARLHVAAVPAHHDRRRPAPVDHEDGALAVLGVERRRAPPRARPTAARDCRRRAPRAGRRRSTLGSVPAGRAGSTARRYRPARAWPMLSTDGVALPEDDGRAGDPGELDGGVARLQPRRPVALVGGVVLLVDDHQADVRERRHERDPRPDDDVRLAGPDPPPLVGALALAQRRVQQRDADGRSARSRSTIGVASAISGTRSSAGRPAARQAAIAST